MGSCENKLLLNPFSLTVSTLHDSFFMILAWEIETINLCIIFSIFLWLTVFYICEKKSVFWSLWELIRLIKPSRNLVNKFGNRDQISTSVHPFRASLCTAKLKINFLSANTRNSYWSSPTFIFCLHYDVCIYNN